MAVAYFPVVTFASSSVVAIVAGTYIAEDFETSVLAVENQLVAAAFLASAFGHL